MFFFFKQKTAYEMRISDWSSDVCSSDLHSPAGEQPRRAVGDSNAGTLGDRGEHHGRKQRINKEIDDEPQMLPRRQHDSFERPEAEIVAAPEMKEAARIVMLGDEFDQRLPRADRDHAEGERDERRSEESRVGNEGGSMCRHRCSA